MTFFLGESIISKICYGYSGDIAQFLLSTLC